MSRRSVAIVGGGAAGCITALQLAHGLRDPPEITMYEKADAPFTTLCGEGIRLETLERFSAFDSRDHIAQRFVGARWRFPGDVAVEIDEACCTLERATWVPDMMEAARRAGVTVHLGKKIAREDVAHLMDRHDLVIGAEGPGSVVRKHIGGTVDLCLGLQARIAGEYETDRLEFVTDKRWSPEYSWVFPKGDILNVGILATGPDRWHLVDDFAKAMDVEGEVVKREAYPIAFNGSMVQRGNAVLVGDAGGLTNPVTKGGLAAIIHASEVLTACFEDGDPLAYGARMEHHPLRSPSFQEALHVLQERDNVWFEDLARFAPPVLRSPGGLYNKLVLAKGLALRPRFAKDLWTLYKAMGLSREYSW